MSDPSTPDAPTISAGEASRPLFDLGTDGLVTQGVQKVKDGLGNPSALAVGTSFVGVGTTGSPAPGIALQVDGHAGFHPLVIFRNTSPTAGEASIRLVNQTAENKAWNVGVLGDGTLFMFSDTSGIALTIDDAGNVSIKTGKLRVEGMPVATRGLLAPVFVDLETGLLHHALPPP